MILDWVPAHFPNDAHGLARFDGTFLYEPADVRKRVHPDWGTHTFDYARPEVTNFLISNALFWLDKYHVDGLRVDAVASMLYLDYSRKPGEWVANEYGGREDLAAIQFLRRFNDRVHAEFPGVLTIAEESTAWPMVSRPTTIGGLGFDLKWDLGWMHDTLDHLAVNPIERKYHHAKLTFRNLYAFTENFVLPLSHDEVVHGKKSLLNKMPGDRWQQFASLRLLFGAMFAQPGKKLLFMGDELGQWCEWDHDGSLDWDVLHDPQHDGLRRWVRDLNTLYRGEPALHELDCHPLRLRLGRLPRRRPKRPELAPHGEVDRHADPRRLQLHPRPPPQLPPGRPPPRPMGGDPQRRRPSLRRQRPGEHRRRLHRPGGPARPPPIPESHDPPPRNDHAPLASRGLKPSRP